MARASGQKKSSPMVWNFIWLDLWEFKLPRLANNGGQRNPEILAWFMGLKLQEEEKKEGP